MMARHTKGTKQIVSLSLNTELVRRVEDLADARQISRSQLIEELIKEGIEQAEMYVKALQNPVLMEALARSFARPEVLKEMAKAIGEESKPGQLEQFHQGMQLLGNYGSEFKKGVPIEVAAKNAVRKTKRKARTKRGK